VSARTETELVGSRLICAVNIFLDVLGELHTPDGEPQATE
jgi:hypothetical protein